MEIKVKNGKNIQMVYHVIKSSNDLKKLLNGQYTKPFGVTIAYFIVISFLIR